MKKNNSDNPNIEPVVPYGQPYRADPTWSTRQKSSHRRSDASAPEQPKQADQVPQRPAAQQQFAQNNQQQPNARPDANMPYQPVQRPQPQYAQQQYDQQPAPQQYARQTYSEQPQVFNPAAEQRGRNAQRQHQQPHHQYAQQPAFAPQHPQYAQQQYGQQYTKQQYTPQPQYAQQQYAAQPQYAQQQQGYGAPPPGYDGNGGGNGSYGGGNGGGPRGRQPNGSSNGNNNGGGQPPKKKRKNKALWITLAILASLLLIVGSIYGYYISRYNRDVLVDQGFADDWDDIDTEGSGPASLQDIEGNSDPIIRVKQKDKNIENILLLGVDGGDMGDAGHRSDSMMIVSINKKDKTIKIASLMRDIWAYNPTRDKYDKLNSAYSYGGPGQTVNVINHNFDMDIQKFVVTDFNGLINLVDVLGGIELEVTDAEVPHIQGLPAGGTVKLSGSQALDYARIRVIDSDFSRVERQRRVIMAMLSTMRSEDPKTQVDTVNESMQYVRSNISGGELTGDLMNMVLSASSGIDQKTIPEEGMYTVNASGTWYMELDWDRQVESLHEFIFGK